MDDMFGTTRGEHTRRMAQRAVLFVRLSLQSRLDMFARYTSRFTGVERAAGRPSQRRDNEAIL